MLASKPFHAPSAWSLLQQRRVIVKARRHPIGQSNAVRIVAIQINCDSWFRFHFSLP
jgi:hypothetical protein